MSNFGYALTISILLIAIMILGFLGGHLSLIVLGFIALLITIVLYFMYERW